MDEDTTMPGLFCSICYNAFKATEEDLIPRFLKCGHTYCSGCLKQIAAKRRSFSICCPICKSETPFSCFPSVTNLPKNFGLLEIIEAQESQIESINIKQPKDRFMCPDHDEPMKVFCHTDNCLVCIYCQVYGAHKGHRCDLASNLSESVLKELKSISSTFGKHHSQLLNARQRVIHRRQEIIDREDVIKAKIKKHFRYLRGEICRLETTAKCSLDLMTKAKLTQVDSQLKILTDIMAKCEQVFTNIQAVETKGDSVIIQKRCDVRDVMTDIVTVIGQCELKPLVKNNLEYSINHNLQYELDHAGEVIEDSDDAEAQGEEYDLVNTELHMLTELRKSLKQIADQEGLSLTSTTKDTEEEKRLAEATVLAEPSLETAIMQNSSFSFYRANVSSSTYNQETQEKTAPSSCISRRPDVADGRTFFIMEGNEKTAEIENWDENEAGEVAEGDDKNEALEATEGSDGNEAEDEREVDDDSEENLDEADVASVSTDDDDSHDGDHDSDEGDHDSHEDDHGSDEGDHGYDAIADDDSDGGNDDSDDGDDEVVDGAVGRNANSSGTFHNHAMNNKQQTTDNQREDWVLELQKKFAKLETRDEPLQVMDISSANSVYENTTESSGSSDDEQHRCHVNFLFRVNNDFSGSRNSASLNSFQDISARHGPRSECSVINCQYHAKASLQCLCCGRLFCNGCAPSSTCCNKNENGHRFSPYKAFKLRADCLTAKNTNEKYSQDGKNTPESPSENLESISLCTAIAATGELAAASPWQCKRCTMVNRSKCLVCEACETSRDFDPTNGKAVCPRCTLINEPGSRKCELCESDLQVRNSDSDSDSSSN